MCVICVHANEGCNTIVWWIWSIKRKGLECADIQPIEWVSPDYNIINSNFRQRGNPVLIIVE